MILLKCPQCGRTAEAPESIVESGEKCYSCGVALVIADEREAERRSAQQRIHTLGILGGALVGAGGLAAVSLHSRQAGIAAIGATFGAVAGAAVGQALSFAMAGFLAYLDNLTIERVAVNTTTSRMLGDYVTVFLIMMGCAIGLSTDLAAQAMAGIESLWVPAACAGLIAGGSFGYAGARLIHGS